jgi:flagellar motility protein MotE (MotC chaperone)
MSAMEFILLIFVIGVVFMLNQPSIDRSKIQKVVKEIDKALTKEFDKRDKKIESLEKEIANLKEKI